MSSFNYAFALPDGLNVLASGDPDSVILKRFFEGYNRAFVLPDEREELDGFRKCLALNLTHRYSFGRKHGELVALIEDKNGVLLGGANFLATLLDVGPGTSCATVALNYIYVEEAARGRGLLRKALSAVEHLALEALQLDPNGAAPAVFIEQNDPLRLTAEEYVADTSHSGLDQLDRLAIWARMGARVVDFPYVQPALSPLQQADDSLIYAVLNYFEDAVQSEVLRQHLESFFGISVLKGCPEAPEGAAMKQLRALDDNPGSIPLLPMEPALAWIRSGLTTDSFASFRELARAAGVG